jgi:thioredoxin 1
VTTEAEFRESVLEADEPVLVLFWATWCPHCQRFLREFERAAGDFLGRVVSATLDDDGNPLWDTYGVQVVPTVALFRNGGLIARRDGTIGRGLTAADLKGFIEATATSA